MLPFGALAGFVGANTRPESYFCTAFALDFFVTDVALVLFFGLATKEIVEATAAAACFIHGGARRCQSSPRWGRRCSRRSC